MIKAMLVVLIFCITGCTVRYQNALCERPDYYEKWSKKCNEFSSIHPSETTEMVMVVLVALAGSGSYNQPLAPLGPVTPNAYGPGVGMDATGKPVTLQGGVIGSTVAVPNAYGPGVHSDQFGNPVRY